MRNSGCALRSAQGAKARFAKPRADLVFDPSLGIALGIAVGAALNIALAIPITMPITMPIAMAAPVGADAWTPAGFTLMHFHDSRKIG
jgi:hypothetical protein